MRILHLIPDLDVGGAQKMVLGLAQKAAEHGHQVGIQCFIPGNAYEDRLRASGIDFSSLGYPGSFRLTSLLTLRRLAGSVLERIEKFQPDLLHVHLFLSKLLLQLIPRTMEAPIILTQHDNNPWWHRRGPKPMIMRGIDRRFSQKLAALSVAISRSVQKDLMTLTALGPSRCPVIYNFVEAPATEIEARPADPLRPKLLMVTRLDMEKKGIDTALETVRLLKDRLPGVSLTIVGQGKDQEAVRSCIDELGLSSSVCLRGFTPDVYSVYREADVLLMPSRWEGFGLTAAEAALAARPVIASRVGGLAEVVVDGETGFLCEPGVASEFADRVLRLLAQKELYLRISTQARISAQERFNQDSVFMAYESLYEKIVQEPPASSV